MGYSFQTTHFRANPDYEFKVVKTDGRTAFKHDLEIIGFPLSKNLGDRISIYRKFWSEPTLIEVQRLVDELHQGTRSGQAEKDWSKEDEQKLNARIEARLKDIENESKIKSDQAKQEAIAEEKKRLQKEIEDSKLG